MLKVLAVVLVFICLSPSWGTEKDCAYDLTSQLALSLNEFDQDPNGGWRPISRKGCFVEAADLIAVYRERNLSPESLLFHEGQMRALAGDYDTASRLIAAQLEAIANDNDYFGYSYYVDAFLAFLLRDRDALVIARVALENHPKPEGFVLTDQFGNPVERSWPPNLRFVRRFEICFDLPFGEAYGAVAEGVDPSRCSERVKNISTVSPQTSDYR